MDKNRRKTDSFLLLFFIEMTAKQFHQNDKLYEEADVSYKIFDAVKLFDNVSNKAFISDTLNNTLEV